MIRNFDLNLIQFQEKLLNPQGTQKDSNRA